MTSPKAIKPVDTERLAPDERGINRAVDLLTAGELVAFPTETVYGLGANALESRAVAGVFAAKERPVFNPLIVHVPSLDVADVVGDVSGDAERLAGAFWPGPLTIVVPARDDSGLSDLVTSGLETVAIRVPAHPLARRLLEEFGGPIAAPSANRSGRVSPTSADHVLAELDGRIAAVLDGGSCPIGLESTIVSFPEDGPPVLLRPGGLPVEIIETALRTKLAMPEGERLLAPGMMRSHYAPQAKMRLNAQAPEPGEVWLGFGPGRNARHVPGLNLSPYADLTEAATNLFAYLRRLDGPDVTIAVAPIPESGLGRAINDRLRRAAAER